MARDGREVWAKRVSRWRDSGLSAREFAAETGINASSLNHWAWKLGRGDDGGANGRDRPAPAAPASKIGWVEVVPAPEKAPAASPFLELVVDARRTVRVPPNFDADALRRLLAVIEAR